ncbi:MAG: sigma-70 family RNA polymerase sigma factor [Leptolyngbya sp. PLA3]|nr:MAG: sigma-70 family RNA polymerase sigma factor [Cyanobacteria bacterium CYA]MCE7969981.1 sigma-70 family RNA polymerase sigma factor [Leptolyngbya sp. PL-A3]
METTVRKHLDRLAAFEPFIRGIAHRLTGDGDLQEDLAQEMRIRMWQTVMEKTDCTDSYLRQACVGRAKDYLKAGRSVDSRKRRGSAVALDDRSASTEPDRGTIETVEFVQRLRRDLVGKARDVADLLGRGRAPVQIASGFGVSRQAIGHRIAEIRERARELDFSRTPCHAAS